MRNVVRLLDKFFLGIFSHLKVSQKIWLGFGLLMGVMLVMAVLAVQSLTSSRSRMDQVVNVNQPAVVVGLELADALDRTSAALGFYLLSKSEQEKTEYEANLARLDELLAQLEAMPRVKNDPQTRENVALIHQDINAYKKYRQRMLELAADFNKNQPGINFSATEMAPVAAEIQQNLSQMLLSEQDEEATPERKELIIELANLRQIWMNVLNNNRAYIAFRAKANIQNLMLYRDGFINAINKLEAKGDDLLNFDQVEAIAAIKNSMGVYFKYQDQLIKVHSSEKWRTDSYLIRTELGPLVARIKHNLDQLIQRQQRETMELSQNLLADVEQTRNLVLGLAILGVVIGALGGVLMIALVTRPLCNTVNAMQDIAHGEGDLTRRLKVRGKDEIAALSEAFNNFVEKVQNMVRQVAGSTSQLAAAAEEMSLVTNETSSGVQRQRSETEQVATAMNEMTATVQEVANHAESAAEAAVQADNQAKEGGEVVQGTITAIERLADEVEKAAGVIHRLEQDSDEIGSVLEVIRGIAEQTNLLALNAAIEAARAGEQGRGFAVVADEVRSLASRTQASTEEIQQMIERLQSGARDAVNVMEEGRSMAKNSVEQAAHAGESLHSITTAVNEITTMNTQIAEAARQQEQVAEEINQNVSNISLVAEETDNGTTQLASASSDLARLSGELQSLVATFKID